MKRVYFLLAFVMMVGVAQAQKSNTESNTFKKFKVDLSVGLAGPGGSGASAGILLAVEPKYAVTPAIAVGLRMEVGVMARGYVDGSGNVLDADVKAQGSYLLTGDYYLNQKRKFRPFVGAGLGSYSIASLTTGTSSKFGEMLRVGFESGHLRLGIEYNIVPKTTINGSTAATTFTSTNSYLGLKLGVCLGGGKK